MTEHTSRIHRTESVKSIYRTDLAHQNDHNQRGNEIRRKVRNNVLQTLVDKSDLSTNVWNHACISRHEFL